MSAVVYNNLAIKLNITPNKCTRYLNDPKNMPRDILEKFAAYLEVHPLHLMAEYGAGLDGVSARDFVDLSGYDLSTINQESL